MLTGYNRELANVQSLIDSALLSRPPVCCVQLNIDLVSTIPDAKHDLPGS